MQLSETEKIGSKIMNNHAYRKQKIIFEEIQGLDEITLHQRLLQFLKMYWKKTKILENLK